VDNKKTHHGEASKMNPFKKPEPSPFNSILHRALWHYYNRTSRVSRLLLSDYEKIPAHNSSKDPTLSKVISEKKQSEKRSFALTICRSMVECSHSDEAFGRSAERIS
jgi:hypothetical protein